MLALDDSNAEAIAYLKSNYEKRRDWEKLIAVNQREVARIANSTERGQRFVEIAKLASEKLKKPAVSIELWERVLEASPEHTEALAELEKLYEREKMWGQAGRRQRDPGPGCSPIRSRRSPCCRSSASCLPIE